MLFLDNNDVGKQHGMMLFLNVSNYDPYPCDIRSTLIIGLAWGLRNRPWETRSIARALTVGRKGEHWRAGLIGHPALHLAVTQGVPGYKGRLNPPWWLSGSLRSRSRYCSAWPRPWLIWDSAGIVPPPHPVPAYYSQDSALHLQVTCM